MAAKIAPILPILNHHLRPVFGWKRFPFLVRVLLSLHRYRRRFFKPSDDVGLRTFKQQFLLAGALYHQLVPRLGEQAAYALAFRMLAEIANAVQRAWYAPPSPAVRSWEDFHSRHYAQMQDGLIRFNEHDEIGSSPTREQFNITRCRFFETFSDMGVPGMTEAFCRSDEVVFNEYSPEMRFHRGDDPANTIARGGPHCVFIFERGDRAQAIQTAAPPR